MQFPHCLHQMAIMVAPTHTKMNQHTIFMLLNNKWIFLSYLISLYIFPQTYVSAFELQIKYTKPVWFVITARMNNICSCLLFQVSSTPTIRAGQKITAIKWYFLTKIFLRRPSENLSLKALLWTSGLTKPFREHQKRQTLQIRSPIEGFQQK